MTRFIFITLFIVFSYATTAQYIVPKINLNPVETPEGIVQEVLNIISAEKGEKRDLKKFKDLFIPEARFMVLYHTQDSFPVPYESVSLDDFTKLLKDQYYKNGFYEKEIGRRVNEYNGIAQVFQSFYTKDSEGEEGKGITSYQLIKYDGRWYITDVLWTTNSNGVEVPEQYLGW